MINLVEALHPRGGTGGSSTAVLFARYPGEERRLAAALDDDGVAWLTVPPARRHRARRAVARAGLRVSGSWLAVPPREPRTLLPLTSVTAADRALLAASALQGRLASLLARCSASILEETAPEVGLLVQRTDAPPPLAWLAEAAAGPPVAVTTAWGDPADCVVLHGTETIVKSTGVGTRRDLLREADALRTLGPTAKAAGARIPSVLYSGPAGLRIALTQTVVPGRRASDLLHARPAELPAFLESVVAWLAKWHLKSRRTRTFSARDVEQLVIAPANALAAEIPGFSGYLERLELLAGSLRDRAVPFAAAHNDLTSWNVLVESSSIAIVDWESATAEALPLWTLITSSSMQSPRPGDSRGTPPTRRAPATAPMRSSYNGLLPGHASCSASTKRPWSSRVMPRGSPTRGTRPVAFLRVLPGRSSRSCGSWPPSDRPEERSPSRPGAVPAAARRVAWRRAGSCPTAANARRATTRDPARPSASGRARGRRGRRRGLRSRPRSRASPDRPIAAVGLARAGARRGCSPRLALVGDERRDSCVRGATRRYLRGMEAPRRAG